MSFYLFDFSRDAGGEKKHFAVLWPALEPATLHESAADDVFACRAVVSSVKSAALLHACPHGLPDGVYVLCAGEYSELMSWSSQATPLPDGDGDGDVAHQRVFQQDLRLWHLLFHFHTLAPCEKDVPDEYAVP